MRQVVKADGAEPGGQVLAMAPVINSANTVTWPAAALSCGLRALTRLS